MKKQDNKKIAVIAPAESLKKVSDNRLFAQKRIEEGFGMKVMFSKSCMKTKMLNSASSEDRAKDLHNAFLDKDIDFIMCAKGGYNSNDLLELIDWHILKRNPKYICGYSDMTVLLNAIYAKTKQKTFYGPNFIDFSERIGFDYSLEYFKKALTNVPFEIIPSKEWSNDFFYKDQINRAFVKNSGPIVIQEGVAKGPLVGGNLCSLNLLQGTPYMPPLKDHILFIEDDDLVSGDCFFGEFNRNFQSLMQTNDAKKIKGLLIGRHQPTVNMDLLKNKYVFLTKMLPKNIPIVVDLDFGHTTPRVTLPIGGMAEIFAKKKSSKIIINGKKRA